MAYPLTPLLVLGTMVAVVAGRVKPVRRRVRRRASEVAPFSSSSESDSEGRDDDDDDGDGDSEASRETRRARFIRVR
jgi:hypothetical protein